MITNEKDVVFGSVLGAGLLADIAYDNGIAGKPAILSVHGGRWFRGTRFDDGRQGRDDNGVIEIDEWARAGFFAMRIDYRLVTCSPAPACFQDVMCAIRWLHAHSDAYGISRDKIFLIGQSAGAHMVALAATLGPLAYEVSGGWDGWPMEFAAGICVSAPYDLVTLDWGSGWSPLGVSWEVARAHASPAAHVSPRCKPLLILHAEDDDSVPIAQADEFVTLLERHNAQHIYKRYQIGGHLKMNEQTSLDCRDFIRSFLERATVGVAAK
jgi:acetyl esterase/lipase